MTLQPGQKIRFHGGYSSSAPRCPVCQFSCVYIDPGEIVEQYHVWDVKLNKFVLHPSELWLARLDTGSYVAGYPDQFEVV